MSVLQRKRNMSLEVEYAVRDVKQLAGGSSGDPVSEHRRVSDFLILFFSKQNSLLLFVLLPSLIAGIYYALIASGQYVSETRMIVRTIGVSEQFDTSEKRGERSIIGGDSLTQDSYIVANYLRSPEIVRKLNTDIGLIQLFSRDNIDLLSRLSASASLEDLTSYWNRHIDTYVDGPSGIIVFTVRAFSAEDAVVISKTALAAADVMIDKISEKAKKDLVARGESDLTESLAEYRQSLNQLQSYQNESGVLDPVSSARMVNIIIAKLSEQKTELTVELQALEAAKADDSARARQMRRSIDALDEQIQFRKNSLAGKTNGDEDQLSENMAQFSQLETRRFVTQALYEATVRNLDTAKSTALKRTTFISIFSDSSLPQKSEYPARFTSWVMLSLGLLTIWITVTLVWMSIEDHRV
jgi:capsular polysaccharide transport system permease protein